MKQALRILMLEDLQDDVGLIERTLSKQGISFITKRVDTQEEFTEALKTFMPDVILSDHALPQFNSLEALTICQNMGLSIPFILVTGTVSEEFAVSCLKQGADDYVLKSNLVRLPSAIQNALRQRLHENKRKKAEKTLRKQNQELVKINKELDSFVYSVSHNLRAPLMSVLGLINLVQIESEKNGYQLDAYFNMMQQSIHRLDDTLKEILDYSRNARSELTIQELDLEKLIEESLERLKYIPGFERIDKRVSVNAAAPLYSDAFRLSVIINNLVSNAIKYCDQNKKPCVIEIEGEVTAERARVVIRDNGIGIDPEMIHRIFDMFYRATERSEGAGLGLYIVKETVEKLNGAISVQSEVGSGTSFQIEVPNMSAGQAGKAPDLS